MEDYLPIHDMMDSSKSWLGDHRHRLYFHHSAGIFLIASFFDPTIVNSDNKTVSVREILENHVLEDLGFIPSPSDYLKDMKSKSWFGGNTAKTEMRKKRNKICSDILDSGVKTLEEAIDYCRYTNACIQYANDGIVLTCALNNEMICIQAESEIDAVNKLIRKKLING